MCCNSYATPIQLRSDPPRFFTRPESSPPSRLGYFKPLKASPNQSITLNLDSTSLYDLLGIPETGTTLEIKQAYKQLARKYHPDVSSPGQLQEYTQRFIRVQEAYETLSDPRRREIYDMDIAGGLHLAFSARRHQRKPEKEMEEKSEWKSRWQSQVSGLKRRSMYKDEGKDVSWGARMRLQRDESSSWRWLNLTIQHILFLLENEYME